MGLFDFLRSKSQISKSKTSSNDLNFKSGKDAIEYVRAYMKTEWRPGSLVVGLIGQARLDGGFLSADLLIPKGNNFVQISSVTEIKTYSSPAVGQKFLGKESKIDVLGLQFGDLVSVLLAGCDDKLRLLQPENDGWIAFIVGKNVPIYSLRDQGWRVEVKYGL